MPDEDAGDAAVRGVTAWNAPTGARPLKAGDTVLTMGSGGVSKFALQLAHLCSARVITESRAMTRQDA